MALTQHAIVEDHLCEPHMHVSTEESTRLTPNFWITEVLSMSGPRDLNECAVCSELGRRAA